MIIKKVTRRILAFTLALTLMLALASTASATTVYWTSADGTSNQATVKKSGGLVLCISAHYGCHHLPARSWYCQFGNLAYWVLCIL